MDTIGVGDPPMVVGIHLSYRFIGVDEADTTPLLRLFNQERFPSPLKAKMPCGETITYETPDDVSLVDVPCPCGDPNHWLVRWEPSYTTAKSNMAAQKLSEENPWTF